MNDRTELIASFEGRVMGGVLHNGGYIHVPQEEAEQILALLKEQPKQKPGHWKAFTQSRYFGRDDDGEPIFRDGRFYVCSECRRKTVIKTQFCPRCGAMMNEAKRDADKK